jgi:hypothetical protein
VAVAVAVLVLVLVLVLMALLMDKSRGSANEHRFRLHVWEPSAVVTLWSTRVPRLWWCNLEPKVHLPSSVEPTVSSVCACVRACVRSDKRVDETCDTTCDFSIAGHVCTCGSWKRVGLGDEHTESQSGTINPWSLRSLAHNHHHYHF